VRSAERRYRGLDVQTLESVGSLRAEAARIGLLPRGIELYRLGEEIAGNRFEFFRGLLLEFCGADATIRGFDKVISHSSYLNPVVVTSYSNFQFQLSGRCLALSRTRFKGFPVI